jgi:hypothetical protein
MLRGLEYASGAGTGQEGSTYEQNGEDALLDQELESLGRGIHVQRHLTESNSIKITALGFFEIPQELRNMIYKMLLIFDVPLIRKGSRKRSSPTSWGMYWAEYQRPPNLSLLQTCRQVNWEASPIFYRGNEFRVYDLYAFLDHLPGLPILASSLTSYPGPGRLNMCHLETLSVTHCFTNLDCGDAGDFLVLVLRLISRCPSLKSLAVHFQNLLRDFTYGTRHNHRHFSNWPIEFQGRARGMLEEAILDHPKLAKVRDVTGPQPKDCTSKSFKLSAE